MINRASQLPVDQLGMLASSLCVVHCIATPLLISWSSVLARAMPGEESTHRLLALAVAVFGASALARGYRVHRHKRVVGLMAAGLACIVAGAFGGERLPPMLPELAVTLAGSACMIVAHRINHSSCRACRDAPRSG
ncbi:MAG: MerC mercury resistance protein [Cyanobacteria bacterium RYN_339]|nr:MerC mercury resistance protein [Cyanobacteria bacterium RYN_339]